LAPYALCVPTPLGGELVCGAACTDTTGCPTGMRCEPYEIDGGFSHQCVPSL
jgi:hypothetical protein